MTSALLLPSSGSPPVLRQTGASTDGELQFGNLVAAETSPPRGTRLYFHRRRIDSFLCRQFPPASSWLQVKRAADRGEEQWGESPSGEDLHQLRPAPLGASCRQVSSLYHLIFNRIRSCRSRGRLLCLLFIYLLGSRVYARGRVRLSSAWSVSTVLSGFSHCWHTVTCLPGEMYRYIQVTNRSLVYPVTLFAGNISLL